MNRPGDRWPGTPVVEEEIRAARRELLRQVDNVLGNCGPSGPSAENRKLAARLRELAAVPWPHADDVVTTAERLFAALPADGDLGQVSLALGEGAFRSAIAHGAQNPAERTLAEVPCSSFWDSYLDVDVVAVKRDAVVVASVHVPARLYRLGPDGEAVYQALRREGRPPTEAARVAQLVTSSPASDPGRGPERGQDSVGSTSL